MLHRRIPVPGYGGILCCGILRLKTCMYPPSPAYDAAERIPGNGIRQNKE